MAGNGKPPHTRTPLEKFVAPLGGGSLLDDALADGTRSPPPQREKKKQSGFFLTALLAGVRSADQAASRVLKKPVEKTGTLVASATRASVDSDSAKTTPVHDAVTSSVPPKETPRPTTSTLAVPATQQPRSPAVLCSRDTESSPLLPRWKRPKPPEITSDDDDDCFSGNHRGLDKAGAAHTSRARAPHASTDASQMSTTSDTMATLRASRGVAAEKPSAPKTSAPDPETEARKARSPFVLTNAASAVPNESEIEESPFSGDGPTRAETASVGPIQAFLRKAAGNVEFVQNTVGAEVAKYLGSGKSPRQQEDLDTENDRAQ